MDWSLEASVRARRWYTRLRDDRSVLAVFWSCSSVVVGDSVGVKGGLVAMMDVWMDVWMVVCHTLPG